MKKYKDVLGSLIQYIREPIEKIPQGNNDVRLDTEID